MNWHLAGYGAKMASLLCVTMETENLGQMDAYTRPASKF